MKKVIFCGFGKLGKDCLEQLVEENFEVGYILTHKENEKDSVDTFAKLNSIEYSYMDARKNLDEIISLFETIKPDFLTSINYRYIIPKEVFNLSTYALNIHGSLLPKYRGRTPHVWSIINGEKDSGITCHIMEETVDTGDIILQKVIPIEKEDTGYTLLKKFELEYPQLLVESIDKLLKKEKLIKQDNFLASYYGKRTPDMGYIDFKKKSSEVIDFVRAQSEPYPGAYSYLIDGKKIIINKIISMDNFIFLNEIGVIKEIDNHYYVRCNDSILRLEEFRIIN